MAVALERSLLFVLTVVVNMSCATTAVGNSSGVYRGAHGDWERASASSDPLRNAVETAATGTTPSGTSLLADKLCAGEQARGLVVQLAVGTPLCLRSVARVCSQVRVLVQRSWCASGLVVECGCLETGRSKRQKLSTGTAHHTSLAWLLLRATALRCSQVLALLRRTQYLYLTSVVIRGENRLALAWVPFRVLVGTRHRALDKTVSPARDSSRLWLCRLSQA